MKAAELFKKYFDIIELHKIYLEKIKYRANVGMDRITPQKFENELEENIKITNEVVLYANSRNVSVEAEIGHIGGNEDGVSNEILHAKCEDCVKIVNATNLCCLAPALGSVHGIYKGEPNLNFERMKEISEKTKLPLVLHGGTGIPDEKIKKAISCGISKININTELQIAWHNSVKEFVKNNENSYDPRKVIGSGEGAIKEVVRNKIALLGSCNKA